jgi:prepilin-type N-terminal cleavage/methylation domain-containing protein
MKQSDKGFSLIEQMVVIVIASIFAAIALGASLNQVRKAQKVEALAAMRAMQFDIEEFRIKENRYPDDVQPNVMPEGVPNFRLQPDTPSNSPFDHDKFCIGGVWAVKLIWYGFDGVRQDDYQQIFSNETGDDAVILVSAIDPC